MIKKGFLTALEVTEGKYNNKDYISVVACYFDKICGHRDKVIDKEDAVHFAIENCVKGIKIKAFQKETTVYLFECLPIELDSMADKYKPKHSVVRGIKKRS